MESDLLVLLPNLKFATHSQYFLVLFTMYFVCIEEGYLKVTFCLTTMLSEHEGKAPYIQNDPDKHTL
jgi:hypothetical protein